MNATSKIEAATLHSAMALAFGKIEAATKGAENPAFKQGGKAIKYADIGAVIGAIKPALIAHGLFFTQHPHPSESGVTVETMLHHAGGESISLGSLFVPANKNDAQGFGSALTYARRYALVTAFGVPVEDDDGNAAAKAGGGQSSSAQSAPSGPPISSNQLAELEALIPAAKLTVAQFNQTFGCATVARLPAAKFDEAKERLSARLAELVKAETNKEAANA